MGSEGLPAEAKALFSITYFSQYFLLPSYHFSNTFAILFLLHTFFLSEQLYVNVEKVLYRDLESMSSRNLTSSLLSSVSLYQPKKWMVHMVKDCIAKSINLFTF